MKEIKHVNLKTFEGDGRMSVGEVYEAFERFDEDYWVRDLVHMQTFKTKRKRKRYPLPILGFRTKKKGRAIWLIAGIHGEEPAGPNAIAQHIGFLNDLSRKIPMVVLPLCNPVGYTTDWRYPDRRRAPRQPELAKSVGSSEHYLLDPKNMKKPRAKTPLSEESEDITAYCLKHLKKYPPVLVLDFHEDESRRGFYIYSQGKLGARDPVAHEVVRILDMKGFNIIKKGKTRFNQNIYNGVIGKVNDSSIDELLAAKYISVNKKLKRKSAAKSVIVVETSTVNVPLETRIKAHAEVLLSSEKFFDMAKLIKKKKQVIKSIQN